MPYQVCSTNHNTNTRITIRQDAPNIIHIGFSRKDGYTYIAITNQQAKTILKHLQKLLKEKP